MSDAQQVAMPTIEDIIREKARALPVEKKQQVLDFVEFLEWRATPAQPRRSAQGICADLNVHITKEEIDENRREMFKNFPREIPR